MNSALAQALSLSLAGVKNMTRETVSSNLKYTLTFKSFSNQGFYGKGGGMVSEGSYFVSTKEFYKKHEFVF